PLDRYRNRDRYRVSFHFDYDCDPDFDFDGASQKSVNYFRGTMKDAKISFRKAIFGLKMVEKQIQHSIDSEEIHEAQQRILAAIPYKMVDKGKGGVRLRSCFGYEVTVQISDFTRKWNRRKKKRYPELYPGLLALGIDERCAPGLAAEIRNVHESS
ncbi:MAG: hypothetical protein GY801_34795, partial [bacterium]|nr:hypothetical protein [bacterium]